MVQGPEEPQASFQLRTARLLLRDLTHADTPLIRSLSQEPEVTRYQTWLKLDTEADLNRWMENALFYNCQWPREAYNLAIVETSLERGIGWIGWGNAPDRTYGGYSFGYALLSDYWGQGYTTEALRAGIDFMFESLGVQGITDFCEAANVGSVRVMEKAGLTEVAHWDEEISPGVVVQFVRYAIRREDWIGRRALREVK